MKIIPLLQSSMALCLVLLCRPVMAQEIPPKTLLEISSPDAPRRLIPSSAQVSAVASDKVAVPGVVVKIAPGADAYPGVRLEPRGGTWDLSGFGHVEARVTNLGKSAMTIGVRVDNEGDEANKTWNAEFRHVEAGAAATITVIFGHSFGYNRSYALKPNAITAIIIYTSKADEPLEFRIDSLLADGPPGEKPATSERTLRIKPKDGIILGRGVSINLRRQVELGGGVKAAADGDALVVSYTVAEESSFKLKPLKGRWHLGNATEVRVKLKNAGSTAVAPTLALTGDQHGGPRVRAESIAPGAEAQVILPFAAEKPWRSVPAGKVGHSRNSEPGTGTMFAADKTDCVEISAAGPATLRVESIEAAVAVATLPEWVGQRPPVPGDWKLAFSDEFDGNAVDLSKWNNTGPNYWDKVSHWSKDNLIVGSGVARLRTERKTGFHNDDPKLKQSDLAGGYLDTLDKFRQRYGYFEARMKLPTTRGLWSAFWMMPDRGPDFPGKRSSTAEGGMEFDIMEHLAVWGPYRYNIAMHWDEYGPDHRATDFDRVYVQPDKDGFITSGLLWLPGQAVFYCNGREVGRWEDSRISNVPAYMMFTVPIGGWDGNDELDAAALPDEFVIDYVRVWQRGDLVTQP